MAGRQQTELTRPFPAKFVKSPPKGKFGSYVPHDVVTQRLIQVLDTPPNFRVTEVIRGIEGQVEACIGEMKVTIDGRDVVVHEIGDCENPKNWNTEGARLKDAASDAYKRCAMRLGCGLHLWSGDDYFLHEELTKDSVAATPVSTPPPKLDEKAATREVKKKSGSKEKQPPRSSEEPSPEEVTASPRSNGAAAGSETSDAPHKDGGVEPAPQPAGSSASLDLLYKTVGQTISSGQMTVKLMRAAQALGLEPPEDKRQTAYFDDWSQLDSAVIDRVANEIRESAEV